MPRLPTTALSCALGILLGLAGEGGRFGQLPSPLEAAALPESTEAVAKRLLGGPDTTAAAVVLVRAGKRTFAGGFGRANGRRASLRTSIPLGALAEPIFGAVILDSARAGVLDLNRPITACGPTRGDQIQSRTRPRPSLRHLLAHASGLVRRSGSTFLLFEPGSAWRPSPDAMQCLQRVVEREERGAFAEITARRVLRPLRMRSTTLDAVSASGAGARSSLEDLERLLRAQLSTPAEAFLAWARADEKVEWGAGWALFEENGERLFARVGGEGNVVVVVAGAPATGDAAAIWVEEARGSSLAHSTALRGLRALLNRPLEALDRQPLALVPTVADTPADPHQHHHP